MLFISLSSSSVIYFSIIPLSKVEVAGVVEEEEVSGGEEEEEAGLEPKHHIRGEGDGECLDHHQGEVFLVDICQAALWRDLQLQDPFLSHHHR